MKKLALRIRLHVDDWTAERASIASNEDNDKTIFCNIFVSFYFKFLY